MIAEIAPYLAVAFSTYVVGTASPGPANMAIMTTAMEAGRSAGVSLALGVISGSMLWGLVAALGLGALLQTTPAAFIVLKIVGGAYLLWLGWKAARAAIAGKPVSLPDGAGGEATAAGFGARHYLRGFGIHLTNPKAVFVWTAVITLGMPAGAPPYLVAIIYGGCVLLGIMIFVGYALAFSTLPMVRFYGRLRRWINAVAAMFFGAAGLRMLLSQV